MSYTKIESKFIEEINSNVTVYCHDKTKARVMTIENDDPNKVFSIAFRTPPINDTGLTHILEHSVLCGSKKYPLKDPFVELLKGSLNTFLNAFTFPDKTMYPCASMNSKDFNNLMSVYLDAVFYPNIYTNPYIFKQEGWHFELNDKNDPITINGVVYNEMKGAFSDPMGVMGRYVMHSLFKDTAYGYESGGDPKSIPDLSYEEFKDFHSKYYSPSNSYILIYGDCDMKERMEFIENEYLNNFEYNDFNTELEESGIDSFVEENLYYNVTSIEDNQDYLSYNIGLKDNLDMKRMIALSLIVELLFTKPGAPIKEAIIKEGLAEDIDVTIETGIKNPFFSLVAINSNKEHLPRIIDIVNSGLKEALLDKEEILANLSFREFKTREAKADGPKGLGYILRAMDGWLYDDSKPFETLEVLKYYDELKKLADTNYFYELIEKEFISNNHKSTVTLLPSTTISKEEDDRLADKLKKYKDSLSKEELQSLIDQTKALKLYQETPDTKEAIDTLPKLGIDDLSDKPIETKIKKLGGHNFDVFHSDYFTNGIAYIDYLFDISDMDANTLQYVKFLCYIYELVNTKKHSYAELDVFEKLYTGGYTTNLKSISTVNKDLKYFVDLKISALENNVLNALSLVEETIFDSIFEEDRILELLKEAKASLEQSISYSGHVISAYRAASYASKAYYYNDMTSAIGYLDFLSDTISSYDTKKDAFVEKLYEVQGLIFTKSRLILDTTCDGAILDAVINSAEELYSHLGDNTIRLVQSFEPNVLNEAILTPYDVNYIGKYADMDIKATGYLDVLKNAISLDYLWQNVRVLGGAYGCALRFGDLGSIILGSYRDPNTKRTLDIFNNLPKFIRELDPSDDEMLKYKIGAIGALDDTMHVSTMGTIAFNNYVSGLTDELRRQRRVEIINCTKADMLKYADLVEEAFKDEYITGLVSQKGMDESKDLFKTQRDLIKK